MNISLQPHSTLHTKLVTPTRTFYVHLTWRIQLPSHPATSAVSIKLPPYWPNDPVLWFTQVEAQFTTCGITAKGTKYAYVVGSLQPDVAQEVQDLLLNPPMTEPYSFLKDEMIKRTFQSEQKRLHQLLTAEELGDRKPTQLYWQMQQLLGERQLELSIMKQLFLQCLPTCNWSWPPPKWPWYGRFSEVSWQDLTDLFCPNFLPCLGHPSDKLILVSMYFLLLTLSFSAGGSFISILLLSS